MKNFRLADQQKYYSYFFFFFEYLIFILILRGNIGHLRLINELWGYLELKS